MNYNEFNKLCNLWEFPKVDVTFIKEFKSREEIEKEYKKSKTIVKGDRIGRNDPCTCGSGKKYKKCCGKDEN